MKTQTSCLSKVVKPKVPIFGTKLFSRFSRLVIMNNKNQSGFSLIELLIVFVVIGIVAGLAIPGLLKSKQIAENENAYNSLRAMVSSQITFNSSNGRYARLDELNALNKQGLGTMSGTDLVRGKFTFTMSPSAPTDEQLKSEFHITATKAVGGGETPYTLDVDESARIIEPNNINHN